MKKRTNKILWTTVICAIVAFLVFITIDFQISQHHNSIKSEKMEIKKESQADVEVEEYDDTTIVTTNKENGTTTTTKVRKSGSN